MRVFKFGGASVKDAAGIRNLLRVLQTVGHQDLLLVVSAMGKTTNALEEVVHNYFDKDKDELAAVQHVQGYHLEIATTLFEEQHIVFDDVSRLFNELCYFLKHNRSNNYNFVYDQVVSYGELLSTTIVSHFLTQNNLPAQWLDVRKLIKTDSQYREANINWQQTQKLIQDQHLLGSISVVQGFIGADENSFTTTLGREGSDYTAAIFGYCLHANEVTIWKDVPGVLNADPRYFSHPQQLEQISYREAIELAFYGATVIHPKTLQPLQSKEIPLYVKSFITPELPGTRVCKGADLLPALPCFIVKKGQLLISISSVDFSFIMEEHISEIFSLLHQLKIKVHLIQNSAISFSICVEDKYSHFLQFREALQHRFKVSYNEDVSLFTIRHFTKEAAQLIENDKQILLKQISRETLQIVTKE